MGAGVCWAEPWGWGCESPGGTRVLQQVRFLRPDVCVVTVSPVSPQLHRGHPWLGVSSRL